MSDAINIFDRDLLKLRRAKSASDIEQYDFLLKRVAEDISDRLQTILRDFPKALDFGSHHGVVGNEIAKLSRVGEVQYYDDCQAMLEKCSGKTITGDLEVIPFENESLDLITSGLSLQFVNDLPGTLIQIQRALKPDGLFIASLMGSQTLHELREAFSLAEEECEGGISPHIAPGLDIRDAGGLLQRAGFTLPVTDSDIVNVTYETPFHLINDLRGMGATNILHDRRRKPLRKHTIMRMVEIYRERFSTNDGRIPATFEIITLTGWTPHESQQKPLTPGSAETRLSDALGTEEKKLGDK